jgi:cytochrome b6-f complex iron-sulfur subunit
VKDVVNIETAATVAQQTRRTFCVHACQMASLAVVGTIIEGCGGGSPTSPSGGGNAPLLSVISASVTNNAIALSVDGTSPLAAIGASALVRAGSNELLVTRTGQASAVALTAICTHEACTITGFQNQRFVCPCHGSQYTTEGAVVNGPATRALRTFVTSFAGSTLTIAL